MNYKILLFQISKMNHFSRPRAKMKYMREEGKNSRRGNISRDEYFSGTSSPVRPVALIDPPCSPIVLYVSSPDQESFVRANTPGRGQIAFARGLDLPGGSSIRLILFSAGDYRPDSVLLLALGCIVPAILLIRFRESLDSLWPVGLFRYKVIQRIKILNFQLLRHGVQTWLAVLLQEIEQTGDVQRDVRVRIQQIQLHRVQHHLTWRVSVPVTVP